MIESAEKFNAKVKASIKLRDLNTDCKSGNDGAQIIYLTPRMVKFCQEQYFMPRLKSLCVIQKQVSFMRQQ
jgi:hypothetical protein